MLFQEYDFEVVVKLGCLNIGLDHLFRVKTGEEPTNLEEGLSAAQPYAMRIADGHFEDIIYFLTTGTMPHGYSIQKKKELVIRAADFTVIVRHLYKMGNDEILCRYVLELEREKILDEAHSEVAGGHFSGRAISQKTLHVGLWWPTLYQDSKVSC